MRVQKAMTLIGVAGWTGLKEAPKVIPPLLIIFEVHFILSSFRAIYETHPFLSCFRGVFAK